MIGMEISARFALPPNSKNYCGKPAFRKRFASYFEKKDAASRRALEESLKSFTAHYAYLRLIASASRLSPFHSRVAEALWIGNALLQKVRRRDLQNLVRKSFCGPGLLSEKKAAELADGLPKGAVPHHSFHALHLHTISGAIAPSLKNADLCRVSWGRVVRAGKGQALLESQRLLKRKGKLALFPCRKKVKLICAGMRLLPKVKTGDLIASHWGFAVMLITQPQAKRLEKYTLRNVSAINRQGKRLA